MQRPVGSIQQPPVSTLFALSFYPGQSKKNVPAGLGQPAYIAMLSGNRQATEMLEVSPH